MTLNNTGVYNKTKLGGNIPWPSDDEVANISWTSGTLPNDAKPFEASLLAVIIIGVMLVIFLLFSMALYIDCRHQRLDAANGKPKRAIKNKKSRMPVFIANSSVNNDALAFANKLCDENYIISVPSGVENC